MNCLRAKEEIKAYIDGELGPVTRLRVARHIARCPECREEMTAMAELANELKSLPQAHVPQGLRRAVMGRVEFRPVQAIRRRWPYATSPAAVVLILVTVVVSAAVLVPTFQRAREASRESICQSNSKECAIDMTWEPHPGSAPGATRVATTREPRVAMSPAPAAKTFKGMPKAEAPANEPEYFGFDKASQPAPASPAAQPLIIKTADLSVRVKDFDVAYNQAVSIAKSTGGYVTDSSAQNDGAAPTSGTLTLRIPVNAFERTLERLGKLGKITSKSISGEDVTGEVVDLEARLRNKRAEERQYLEIMNRAKRVPDIVTVTSELSRVRGEIEEAQGWMKYLKSSVAMSTINLTLSERPKPKPVKSSIERTWTDAVAALAGAGNRLAGLAIWLAVFSPFWALPLGGWVYVRKRAATEQRGAEGA